MKIKKMKPKNERISFGKKKKSVKWNIDVRGKWKAVELDPSLYSEKGLDDLVCFEELRSYRLIDSEKAAAKAVNDLKKNKTKKRKAKESDEAGETEDVESKEEENTTEPPKKKTKRKNKKVAAKTSDDDKDAKNEEKLATNEVKNKAAKEETKKTVDTSEHKQSGDSTHQKKKKKLKQQTGMAVVTEEHKDLKSSPEMEKSSQDKLAKPLKQKIKNWTNAALSSSDNKNSDVSAWKDLFVPSPVLKALSSLGFSSPTPIQALALPSAIRDRLDILGAAETGSGKTLAFGIPMIHTILEWKDSSEKTTGDSEKASKVKSLYLSSVNELTKSDKSDIEVNSEGEDEGDVDQTQEASDEDDTEDEDEQLGCVKVIDNAEFDFEEKSADGRSRPLLGLVLTPTRELAVQVKHHIDAVAKFTGIKTAIVVGGMSQPKQRRMLNHRPEIIIATPGRLWDLIKEQHPHLLNLRQLKCLVIDEADRMVERGHFAELESLLEMLNTTHSNPTRQTFVFSATLTMAHSLPTRFLQKKKILDTRSKQEILMEKVGMKTKPKVIDLTRKEATVETLTETQIHCQKDEKDFYLYYFMLQHPGRTMVFANSIECIKRLNSLLMILDCSPLHLHANMHQKQRLKNLERFAEEENCVLLTTDVAARGLDIPNIQHVIHYQVPRTSETYVHRSGRTARASKEGLSLLLIGPDDVMNFRKIYKTLGKEEEELPVFPIETKCMEAIKERVNLARSIEKIEYYNSREKQHDSWFRKAAEALDVDLDDDLLLGGGKEEDADREQRKMVKGMKKQLKHLISQPVFKGAMKTKYPTKMGKLLLPHMSGAGMESALTKVSVQKKKEKLKKSLQTQQKKQKKKGKQQQ